MKSIVKWGAIAALAMIAALAGIGMLADQVGVVLTLLMVVLGTFAFIVGSAVAATAWAVRKGIAAVRGVMDVPQQERFDSVAQFEAAMSVPAGNDELTEAAERIRRIKKAAHGVAHRALAAALERVATAAEALLTQAHRSRTEARRLRGQLVHQLGHVEVVALNIFRMQESGGGDPALIGQATHTLGSVATDFEKHYRRTDPGKVLETEARLELLAQEVGAGRPPPPPQAQARPAVAAPSPEVSLTPTLDRLFGRQSR